MADVVAQPVPSLPGVPPGMEPEIHVIPEKYYGAALRARLPSEEGKPKDDVNAIVQPSRNAAAPAIIVAVVVLLLGAGGAFVYFNKDKLFPPQTSPVVVEPPPPPPATPAIPAAPTNLTATSTNPQSVSLSWVDNASNESGYRIERSLSGGPYSSLSFLGPNSNSFLDPSVQQGATYAYRVFALNEGGDSPPSNEGTATVAAPPPIEPPPSPPPVLPSTGLDSDGDALTDLEERLMTSDANDPDTDGDTFNDGNEVFHLYNPKGSGGGRLLDAGLVTQLSGGIGWTMQVPVAWKADPASAADGSSSTIMTEGPERFRLTIEANPGRLPIAEWFQATHPDSGGRQPLKYTSKRGYAGIIAPGQLVTYIPWDDRVFVLRYDQAGQSLINYRTLYSMMLNSLTLSGAPQVAPAAAGTPLPFEPDAKTGEVAQPTEIEGAPSAPPSP